MSVCCVTQFQVSECMTLKGVTIYQKDVNVEYALDMRTHIQILCLSFKFDSEVGRRQEFLSLWVTWSEENKLINSSTSRRVLSLSSIFSRFVDTCVSLSWVKRDRILWRDGRDDELLLLWYSFWYSSLCYSSFLISNVLYIVCYIVNSLVSLSSGRSSHRLSFSSSSRGRRDHSILSSLFPFLEEKICTCSINKGIQDSKGLFS